MAAFNIMYDLDVENHDIVTKLRRKKRVELHV